jgi:NTE family protein
VLTRPDILVLGSGGILGEAWMTGVLAGLEDASGVDLSRCEYFLGTSAGAIVAYRLAAGERLRRPRDDGDSTAPPRSRGDASEAVVPFTRSAGSAARAATWALGLGTPAVAASLSLASRPGALARTAVLRTMPRPQGSLAGMREAIEASNARFDGRLRVAAVDRQSGRRVIFGAPGAPSASVAEAVEASCTVPWLFEPVRIGGREYVDGGVWSPTNLDACPAGRSAHVLCLNPTAGLQGRNPAITLARNTSKSVTALEATILRTRGASVSVIGPDSPAVMAIGTDLMAPAPRTRVLASGYRQGLELALSVR